MAQEKETLRSYTERRLLRERAEQLAIISASIDAGERCECVECGQVHWKRRKREEEKEVEAGA